MLVEMIAGQSEPVAKKAAGKSVQEAKSATKPAAPNNHQAIARANQWSC